MKLDPHRSCIVFPLTLLYIGAKLNIPLPISCLQCFLLSLRNQVMSMLVPLMKQLGATPFQLGLISSTYGALQLTSGPFVVSHVPAASTDPAAQS
jgi:hypothetical protein